MKKTKKTLASLAIVGMVLTMIPFNVFASGTVPTRLAGNTAEQTAVAIANQTGWTGKAILASSASYGMADALTAGPLASYLKAPILLTGAGVLDAITKAELTKLSVKTVYVTSGTAVISQAVLNELTDMGITVVPLGGVDKYETSINIAKKMVGVTKVAVVNSLQDALSIAAIASAANQPILLTGKDTLPASVARYLAANPGITTSDVIGGTGVISETVKAMLPSATRHAGNNAYDTNNQVIQDFNSSLNYGNVYLANGVTGIDALASAPLAAQTKSAIVLTDGTLPAASAFVKGKIVDNSVITAIGGAAVVPEFLRTAVVKGVVELTEDQAFKLLESKVTLEQGWFWDHCGESVESAEELYDNSEGYIPPIAGLPYYSFDCDNGVYAAGAVIVMKNSGDLYYCEQGLWAKVINDSIGPISLIQRFGNPLYEEYIKSQVGKE